MSPEFDRVVAHIDFELATMTMTNSAGESLVAPWPTDRLEESSAIKSLTFTFGADTLLFATYEGDSIVAELPTAHGASPIGGRPVVYLDQNHWSTLSNALHDQSRCRASERSAAEWLIEAVRERQVLLPMSAAHMAETCQWSDQSRRYGLALTILQLSGGWKIRDPLAFRVAELRDALLASVDRPAPQDLAPVTLEPGALFERLAGRASEHRDYPPDIALALRALTDTSIIFDVMLDREAVSQLDIPAWREHFQRFTDWLGQQAQDARLRRERTRVKFLSDIQHELALAAHEAAVTDEELSAWFLNATDEAISELPSLGLYREVLHERLSNPGTTWEQNDLTDIMYLTCGAAYADFLVAERAHAAHLRQAMTRLGRPVNVFRRLCDLQPALEAEIGR